MATEKGSSKQGSDKSLSPSKSSPSKNYPSTFAFVFDIDGVLIDDKKALPGATKAIEMLLKRKISFILGIPGPLNERQFVQSHTPFKGLLEEFADKNILALGGSSEKTRRLAQGYRFKNVITTADMVKTFAGDAFAHLGEDERMEIRKFGKKIPNLLSEDSVQVSAILVFLGPKQTLELDAQIVMSFLLSQKGAYPITSLKNGDTSLPNNGYLQDDQPKVYFSNMDENWATATNPTWTQQLTFMHALKDLWDQQTDGADLKPAIVRHGKPSETAFVWGERALHEWHKDLNPEDTPPRSENFKSRYNSKCKSILVESGLHEEATTPEHEPDYIVPGVREAVELFLSLEKQNDESTETD
ncbi:hypothetical protein BKA64DRAFT_695516 [Cadophora sp. MPI-SDFR-AT-0126]|nr:hypothetical protein BKA64DRAFT_695516 [Leotiomycetes sp. MPI-SDFR-AT-0126]